MTIELTLPTDTFDRDARFAFEYLDYKKRPTRGEGYLFHDDRNDEMFLMQAAGCLKSHYTDADRAHIDRIYNGEQVVRHGDTVSVGGKLYTVKVLGNYSDAGRLIPA
jgi:hypothetical protein